MKAFQILSYVAEQYQSDKANYSRQEILKKINEIKYLAAQKKVPKLTLRKQIHHLENKLEDIFSVEKQILASKKKESAKVAGLKKELTSLKKRLASVEDKDLQKKVDKLTHLLGETLAKKEVLQDIALSKKVEEELGRKPKVSLIPTSKVTKIKALQAHIEMLKKVLDQHMKAGDGQKYQLIAGQVTRVEETLQHLLQRQAEPKEIPVIVERPVRHTMLLHEKNMEHSAEMSAEKELPLPPPPRMGV